MAYNNYDISAAQAGRWFMTIDGFNDVAFRVKSGFLPNVSVGMIDLGGGDATKVKIPGDRIEYDNLSLEFFIDSKYANYKTMLNWLRMQPKTPSQRTINLHLLDGQGRMQGVTAEFTQAFPANISPVLLDSDNSDTELTCQIDIFYQEFNFI